jgi:hypothetical protein
MPPLARLRWNGWRLLPLICVRLVVTPQGVSIRHADKQDNPTYQCNDTNKPNLQHNRGTVTERAWRERLHDTEAERKSYIGCASQQHEDIHSQKAQPDTTNTEKFYKQSEREQGGGNE